jgi:hypothetical protein
MTALFGAPPAAFRWFDVNLPQAQALPNVVVQRISTARLQAQDTILGLGQMSKIRFQFTCRGEGSNQPTFEAARQVGAAVIQFLGTVNLTSGSNALPPRPAYVLGERVGMDYNANPPVPLYVVDAAVYNIET